MNRRYRSMKPMRAMKNTPDRRGRRRYRTLVLPLRTASPSPRFLCAALIGLLLALRLLMPPGFMPAFAHGSVTIIICPDAGEHPASTRMHHEHQSKHQQQCPYASASSLGALGADVTALLDSFILASALPLGHLFLSVDRPSKRLRPPLRGPPASA